MLAGLLNGWARSQHRKEISAFVANLRTMDSDELGLIVASATDWRHKLREDGLEVMYPSSCLLADPGAPLKLSQMIRQLQTAGNPQFAAGLMVWLHSLRAIHWLELRGLGRSMWAELQRGFPEVEKSAAGAFRAFGLWYETEGYREFPDGLSPTPR